MAQTVPPSMTAAPTSPDRSDRATFSARSIALDDWRKNYNVPESVAIATNLYNNAVDAFNNATAAAASAIIAAAASTAAINAAGAVQWVSATTYTLGFVVWSPINFQTYRRAVAGAGTTDPSADPVNWTPLGASSPGGTLYLAANFGAF